MHHLASGTGRFKMFPMRTWCLWDSGPTEENGFDTSKSEEVIFYRSKIPVTPTDYVNHLCVAVPALP